MNEQAKLDEAVHFRRQMKATEHDPEDFKHNVSAFLTAARSVLMYARLEAESKPMGQAWLDRRMSDSQLLQFFKKQRDLSVHHEPVSLERRVDITINEHIAVGESFSIELIGPDGKVKERRDSAPAAVVPAPRTATTTTEHCYWFQEWEGTDQVDKLCDRLLMELHDVVADGRKRGFLTPPLAT